MSALGDPGRKTLPSLPRDDDGPVFAEPWQAQAFAIAVHLHSGGHFTWSQWAQRLSTHIAKAGPTDDPANYYTHWLVTLEELTTEGGLTSESELMEKRKAWARAAERTPHGQPIEL